MKKQYSTPTIEIEELLLQDICTISTNNTPATSQYQQLGRERTSNPIWD